MRIAGSMQNENPGSISDGIQHIDAKLATALLDRLTVELHENLILRLRGLLTQKILL